MPHQQVRHPRVTQPSATVPRRTPFDLHVLGTPPAFTLSQDQTLHHDSTDVAFVPLCGTSFSQKKILKRNQKCLLGTHGGFLTHLALPLTLSGTSISTDTSLRTQFQIPAGPSTASRLRLF